MTCTELHGNIKGEGSKTYIGDLNIVKSTHCLSVSPSIHHFLHGIGTRSAKAPRVGVRGAMDDSGWLNTRLTGASLARSDW